jgi:FkbM family methyltransferase
LVGASPSSPALLRLLEDKHPLKCEYIHMTAKTIILNHIREVFKLAPIESLLCKATQGKTCNDILTKLAPNHYQYKPNSIRKVRRRGLEYNLDISDLSDWTIFYGVNDPSQNALLSLIDDGDIVFDIGTNMGYNILPISKIIGDKGYVYGFEPLPLNYSKCLTNIALNSLTNCKVYPIALSNYDGKAKLTSPRRDNLGTCFVDNKASDGVEIKVKTLDNFLLDDPIPHIDLIKIDVEGHELHVLQGAAETIKKFRPIMFIEVSSELLKRAGNQPSDVINFLKTNHYQILHAQAQRPIEVSDYTSHCHFDVICLPS